MADMSKGFDTLITKLKQAEQLSAKIEKSWEGFGKSVAAGAGQAAKFASAGGQKAVGAGKSMMTASFGNINQKAMNDAGDRVLTVGDVTTGKANKIGNRLGLANVQVNNIDSAVGARNQQIIDSSKSRLASKFGIDLGKYNGLDSNNQQIVSSSMYGPQDTVNLMSGMAGAFGKFLPNVGQSISMAGTYYNASVANGQQTSRKALQQMTYGAMSGGMTSVGSDASVAEYLMSRGMSTEGQSKKTYLETLGSVSGAAKYMNIKNETAAQSIEGLTSGSGSGQMLKNFGIYTADLATGKEKTQTQIFEELAQRLTAGRKAATTEQTQMSIRRGALGATINSFFQGDEAGSAMFKQYLVDRTKGGAGKALGSMLDQSAGSAERNPLNAQLTMNASDTAAMTQASASYISGMEAAIGPLQALNTAAGVLAKTFAGIPNALAQTLFAHNTTQGLMQGLNTITGFGSKAVSGITEAFMGMDALNPAPALTTMGLIGGSAAVSAGTALATGAGVAIAGGAASLLTGSATGGTSSNSSDMPTDSGYSTGNSGQQGPAVLSDYAKFKVSTPYGGGTFANSNHQAVDYVMSEGTDVKAVAAGVVIKATTGAVNNYAAWSKIGSSSGQKPVASLGNQIHIKHDNGYISIYGHLSTVLVKEGNVVKKGQVIGKSGNTGTSSGAHLHLQVTKNGSPVDPAGLTAGVLGDTQAMQADTAASNTATGNSAVGSAQALYNSANNVQGMSNAMSLFKDLYSGDTAKITGAIRSMAANVGVSGSAFNSFQALGTSLAGASASSLVQAQAPLADPNAGGSSPTNNVVINVTIPEVTQSEAMKFAQLVKQYMEDNTLMSNTGTV